MKIKKFSKIPEDLNERVGAKPNVCYQNHNLEDNNLSILHKARKNLKKINEILLNDIKDLLVHYL